MNRRVTFRAVVLLMVMLVGGCRSTRSFRGPINGAFQKPIVVIVPTQERGSEANAQIRKYVLGRRTRSRALRDCAILTDREALQADLSGKSLVVYGTPSGNAFLAKHMSELLLTIAPDRVKIGQVVSGEHLRVITAWTNPQDPCRGMIVYTAQRAQDIIDINSVYHGHEDFLIVRGRNVLHRGIYCKNSGEWSRPIPLPTDRRPKDFAYAPSCLAVSGSPEQIGRQIGEAYGPTMAGMIPLILEQIKNITGLESDEQLYARASNLAASLETRDVAELQSLAKAAGLDYRDVLCLNLYYSLCTSGPACRQIAAWGQASKDGRMLHGRNLDWPDTNDRLLCRNNVILNVKPDDGIEYVILTWPGYIGAITGTNRAGLTVAANALPPFSNSRRRAEPTFFTLKRILRTCRTVQEAAEEIRKVRPLHDMSILISQANEPTAIVVEVWGGKVRVRGAGEGEDIIGNANHPTTDACRYSRARRPAGEPTCTAAREIGLPIDVERMKRTLAHPTVLQLGINLLSVVFDPTRNRMFLSCGRLGAAKGTFTEYPLFPE